MRRDSKSPILTRESLRELPPPFDDVSSVFNPGGVRLGDEIVLLLRVQLRSRETRLLVARSQDGVEFQVEPSPVVILGLDAVSEQIHHVYDPRLTMVDGRLLLVFAADVTGACRLGIAEATSFPSFELVSFDQEIDQRNGVLFPRRHEGSFLRLERPNDVQLDSGPVSGDAITLSSSRDLVHWKRDATVLSGRPHYFDERIGAGPPPILTERGYLLIYHGVATHFMSSNLYQAGVALLDREDPTRLLGRCRYNILEPREPWELMGQVPGVVFPSAAIPMHVDAEGNAALDSELLVYYGAADSCVGLARARIHDLVEQCVREDLCGELPARDRP